MAAVAHAPHRYRAQATDRIGRRQIQVKNTSPSCVTMAVCTLQKKKRKKKYREKRVAATEAKGWVGQDPGV